MVFSFQQINDLHRNCTDKLKFIENPNETPNLYNDDVNRKLIYPASMVTTIAHCCQIFVNDVFFADMETNPKNDTT